MQESRNYILQLTDLVSGRRCALRVEALDAQRPLGQLLEKYLKNPPLQRLRSEGRITADSAEKLESIQDLVYVSSDEGLLHDMFAGVVFRQGSRELPLDEAPDPEPVRLGDKEAALIDLVIDRTTVGYDRNWVGFNKRRWMRHAGAYGDFVHNCLAERLGHADAETVLRLESAESKLKLVEVLARVVWESDFENYSRFRDRKLVYKTGDETVRNIMAGSGGICSEKVQALKFLTDHYGLESDLVLAGPDIPGPVPEARLRELLETFDFRFSRRYMRYWQHTALLYNIGGLSVLVDATNGNIPLLLLKGSDAQTVLGYQAKASVRVRMAVHEEEFYYHRVSQDIPQRLSFAMEGWIPYVDLVQVFDNELGLCISKDFMVAPIVSRTEKGFDRLRREYLTVCGDAGLACTVSETWDLESPSGRRFEDKHPESARKTLESEEHLLKRYDDCHGAGHQAGLVVIELQS